MNQVIDNHIATGQAIPPQEYRVNEPIKPTDHQKVAMRPGASFASNQSIYQRIGLHEQAFHQSLLDLSESTQVSIQGRPGCNLIHAEPGWQDQQWADVVKLRGAERSMIEGLAIRGGGGDGVYVGPTWTEAGNATDDELCRDVVLSNLDIANWARNAITIAGVHNLIVGCVRSHSPRGFNAARNPQGGLWVEPAKPEHHITGARLGGLDVLAFATPLGLSLWRTTTATQIGMSIEGSLFESQAGHQLMLSTGGTGNLEAAKGTVVIKGCTFRFTSPTSLNNAIRADLHATTCPLVIEFIDCTWIWNERNDGKPISITGEGINPMVFDDKSMVWIGPHRVPAKSLVPSRRG